MNRFVVGTIVQHYRNRQLYEIVGYGQHTETGEKLAIYRQLYSAEYPFGHIWVRPEEMFHSQVDGVPRFSKH
jgi:hypothetical protein